MARNRHARGNDLAEMDDVEIRHRHSRDFAGLFQAFEFKRSFDVAGYGIVPPVKLHGIELVDAEPSERAVNYGLDIGAVDRGKVSEIRYEFCEYLYLPGVLGIVAAEVAD